MSKRISEAATLKVDPSTKALRVCLISEGKGSSADFPREFFTQENGDRLAKALSFPGHPKDLEHPEWRDPLSAIARIGESVTVEEHDGKLGLWSDYHVSKTRPEVQAYLEEYGEALGLSVFSDSDGHADPVTGKWVAESLTEEDPYRSVDLVTAAGRGGKFSRVAESLGLAPSTSATAEEEEETHMDKDIEAAFNSLGDKIESAVSKLTEALAPKPAGSAPEAGTPDAEAVNKAVAERLATRDKVKEAVDAAKLTESQAKAIMARVDSGATFEDVQPDIESAKSVLAEARKGTVEEDEDRHVVAEHLGDNNDSGEFKLAVPGNFGKVG